MQINSPAIVVPVSLAACHAAWLKARLRHQRQAYVLARQTGWLRHGTRRRELTEWYIPKIRPSTGELA